MIHRGYPSKKQKKWRYPRRYGPQVFKELKEEVGDMKKFQNDYEKWKEGINYITNRKITIGGKLHRKLGKKFTRRLTESSVLIKDLINIDPDEYLQETKRINDEIDAENVIIENYNESVDIVIEKIKKLERWDDFIEFEGNRYGLYCQVLNNIHIANDCLGEMIFTRDETVHTFNDRPYCNYDDKQETYSIYKCSKCDYEHRILKSSTGGGSQYISKSGIWWKNR